MNAHLFLIAVQAWVSMVQESMTMSDWQLHQFVAESCKRLNASTTDEAFAAEYARRSALLHRLSDEEVGLISLNQMLSLLQWELASSSEDR